MHVNDPAPGDGKVYEFDKEEYKQARVAALQLENDVKGKSAEIQFILFLSIHPVSLVKLGIGYSSIVVFFVVFPFVVFELRKLWSKFENGGNQHFNNLYFFGNICETI